MNYYLCNKCDGIVQRSSTKKKIRSICDEVNKGSVLTLIESADRLAETLRKKYQSKTTLESFKPKDRGFLEEAFEQGAKIVFNRLK